jgi:hypothetical protein
LDVPDGCGRSRRSHHRALHDHLHALERHRCELDAAVLAAMAELDRRGPAALGGSVSAAEWVRDRCGVAGAEARRRGAVASTLERLPLTRDALAAGRIGFDHARVMASACHGRSADALVAAEPRLVATAASIGADDFAVEVRRFCDHVAADAGRSRAERHRERRRAGGHIDETGMGQIHLSLAPVEHRTVLGTAALIADDMYRAAHPDRSAPLPDDASHQQRLADAFVEMARRALITLPEAARDAKPVVMATIDHADLTHAVRDATGELIGHGDLPADRIRRLACDCDLIPVVLGADSDVLDAGRAIRCANRAMRRQLTRRDQHCRFPGCDRPAEWCDAHHILWWDHGGTTALHNPMSPKYVPEMAAGVLAYSAGAGNRARSC